jgi:hypothetical protein
MKKTVITILTIGLIAGALFAPSADARKRRRKPYKRTASQEYTVPAFGQADIGGFCPGEPAPAELDGCASFRTKGKDKYVKVVIKDASGTPVTGTLSHPDQNGDGFVESLGSFCGKSRKVAIQPGAELIVFPYAIGSTGATSGFGGPEECHGVATQGKIKATFTGK